MSPITPDLQQNISVTLYLLFSHNYEAFAYFLGAAVGLGLAIWKPSRYALFVFLGFAILLFSFEYDKHIISALRDQTMKSLVTVTPHYKVSKIIDVTITYLLPIIFYVSGWAMVFVSIIYAAFKLNKPFHNPR